MQILFETGDGRQELDVRVQDPDARVADLIAAVAPTASGASAGVLVDARFVAAEVPMVDAGLFEGARVSPAQGPAEPAGEAAPLVVDVIGGLAAGGRAPLHGTTSVGRDRDNPLRMADPTVSAHHAEISLGEGGAVTVCDLGSHNGTWIDGEAVVGALPLPDGALVQLGASQLRVRPSCDGDRPLAIGAERHVGAAGTVPFNRRPRPARPEPPAPVALPEPPAKPTASTPLNIIAIIAPAVFGVVMVLVFDNILFGLFALLSPIMAIGNFVDSRRRGKKTKRQEAQRYAEELDELATHLVAAGVREVERRTTSAPDPAEVLRRATAPSVTLWERRPADDDFLTLRAGIGDIGWAPPTSAPGGRTGPPPADTAEVVAAGSLLTRAPVNVDLSEGGVLGVVGDRTAGLALARSLVVQAAVHHGPADLVVAMATAEGAAAEWDWAKWLPHTLDASGSGRRLLAGGADASDALLRGLLESAGDDPSRRSQTILAVLDDEALTEGRRSPARTLLRGGAGPVAGIVLAATEDRLPAVCTAVVDLRGPDGEADLHRPQQGEHLEGFLATGVDDATARRAARALARFEDPELEVVGAGLPPSVGLLPLLGLPEPSPAAVGSRWREGGTDPAPAAPIGMGDDGVFTVDLGLDGPHGLVAGTTGSGKSELLRSLVAGLAANVGPDHLTFVLVDFKGGSAFDECARLPHTVGMVTDLDQYLGERALRCLEAELRYREQLLRRHGATDLREYRQLLTRRSTNRSGGRGPVDARPAAREAAQPPGEAARDDETRIGEAERGEGRANVAAAKPASQRRADVAEPLPRLCVVIDEFATLKAELPDFVESLVGIAQRGRSLGVHLVLATQRPSGAVSENIKANTNLRIALRVQDRSDSTDVIGTADAERIGRHQPGRAYLRLGPGEVVPVQTALSTGVSGRSDTAAVDVAPFRYGPTPRSARATTAPVDDGRATDLVRLVDAIGGAFAASGAPPPRRPWPEPLPADLAAAELMTAGTGDGHRRRPATVAFALADDPDAQAQYPTGWTPAEGNLMLFGIVGSGTTTALAALALALAAERSPDERHLYVLDFGAGELAALAGLPHVGAVVGPTERERQVRLVRMLRGELDRRRRLGPAERAAEAEIVVLLDGLGGFRSEFDDVIDAEVADGFGRVFGDGPEVGIRVVTAADRAGAAPAPLSALVRQKLLFRLADPHDYGNFGVPQRAVPDLPPGRAMVAETGQVVQVARPGASVADAVAHVAAGAKTVGDPARGPAAVGVLPTAVDVGDIRGTASLASRPWFVPLGLAESDLAPAGWSLYEGEHGLVAGPARSGKTTALATVAEVVSAADPSVTVVAVAGPRSWLRRCPHVDRAAEPAGAGPVLAEVAEGAAGGGRWLVLVDDAEGVDDADGALAALIGRRLPDVHLVVAGRADALRGLYTHWTKAVRASKVGLLLRPDTDLDGDLVGARLPRRSPVALTVGRGYAVTGGDLALIQVAGRAAITAEA